MDIKKPVFVVGVGRSGSTLLHDILAGHPHSAWLSQLCDRHPEEPQWNRLLLRAIDYPLVGRLLRRRYVPVEPYKFWEHHAKGFRRPCRDLVAADVTRKVKEDVRAMLAEIPTAKRNRLLVKVTGWPRIAYLHEIWSDGKFVHLVRDGRAVVNSMVNVDWWGGWGGPQQWRWGELTQTQRKVWEKHDRSFLALAAIQWNIMLDAMETARETVAKDAFMEVKYEDLCANPVPVLKEVSKFCELDWLSEFEAQVKKHDIRNTNTKWQKELTPAQQRIIEEVMGERLKRYGYLQEAAASPPPAVRSAGKVG